jgi:hypothetical protein
LRFSSPSLCKSIKVVNAAIYFLTAYLHNATILKQIATKFIVDNYDLVRATPELELIADRHSPALLEILDLSARRK